MSRVLILVEGQTEEVFIQRVLGPRLADKGLYLLPTILVTKARKRGANFKGGVSSYSKIKRDLKPLLGDSNAAAVTTMLDYYRLPSDFPGWNELPQGNPYDNVKHLEASLSEQFDDPRLLPYISLHEFEALLLAEPDSLLKTFPEAGHGIRKEVLKALEESGGPEKVNDGETTHPSARLETWFPGFQKTLHGGLITQRTGLARLRGACPHFDAWLRKLENLL